MWKTAFLDKLLVRVFSSLSFHLFIWFEGVRKVFGVFCAGSSHVKKHKTKNIPQIWIYSSFFFLFFPFSPREPMLKPLTSGETPLRQTPVFLLLVSCASHPWPYRGWFLWRFWGSLFRPATPLWFEWFFMSSVYHCSIAFLVSLLFYRSERNWGTLNSRVDLSKNWFESGSVNPESVRRACPSEPGNEHVLEQKRTLPDWLEPSWLLEIGCPEHFDFVTLRRLQAQLLGSQGMRATLDWWPPCWINWTLSRHCLGVLTKDH